MNCNYNTTGSKWIKQTSSNSFDSVTYDEKAKELVRGSQGDFFNLAGTDIIYLAVDVDITTDFIWKEDTFPQIIQVYDNVKIRTTDGDTFSTEKKATPFGYYGEQRFSCFLDVDTFRSKTLADNINNPLLKGSYWEPKPQDVIIVKYSNLYLEITDVTMDDGQYMLTDRYTYKIHLKLYDKSNIDSRATKYHEATKDVNDSLQAAFSLGLDPDTGTVTEIKKIANLADIDANVGNDSMILDQTRSENFGDF